jgi:phosphoenolpyruvate synthase/pyruvate phosphate dikinase
VANETDRAEALVLSFAELDRGSLPLAGGKAANLGELTRAGFPVPPGFCVTTRAYASVTAGGTLADVLAELAGVPATDIARLEVLAGRARAALLAAPMPEAVRAAVARAYG